MVPSMTELDQAHERYEDFAVEAVRRGRGGRGAPKRQAAIRRALGLRVIALGRRLVGEPPLELARSR